MITTLIAFALSMLLGPQTNPHHSQARKTEIITTPATAAMPSQPGPIRALPDFVATEAILEPSVTQWAPGSAFATEFWLICLAIILGVMLETGRSRELARMRRLLVEVERANKRLSLLNEEKTEFLHMAAHDLKNPLNAILLSAEMLRSTRDRNQFVKLVEAILTAGERMQGLITTLLDARAIERGQVASTVEPCDLRALIDQCVEQNQPLATRKSIAICTDLAEVLWASVNRAATSQILDNLISNALKFSPPRTTIRVRALAEGDHALVTICDQGPGISEDDQTKLFRKYACLSARPTGGESSNRLGLAITKRLAESMRGTIRCQSRLGAGSTFTLELPACQPEVSFVAPEVLRLHNALLDARHANGVTSEMLATGA